MHLQFVLATYNIFFVSQSELKKHNTISSFIHKITVAPRTIVIDRYSYLFIEEYSFSLQS